MMGQISQNKTTKKHQPAPSFRNFLERSEEKYAETQWHSTKTIEIPDIFRRYTLKNSGMTYPVCDIRHLLILMRCPVIRRNYVHEK